MSPRTQRLSLLLRWRRPFLPSCWLEPGAYGPLTILDGLQVTIACLPLSTASLQRGVVVYRLIGVDTL